MDLAGEMLRRCDSMNHHFRCAAGEVSFMRMKHLILVTVDDLRLTLHKGNAEGPKIDSVGFGIRLHRLDERNTLLESYTLTIDQNLMCSLTDAEERVSISEMCERFLKTLCNPCGNPRLMQ